MKGGKGLDGVGKRLSLGWGLAAGCRIEGSVVSKTIGLELFFNKNMKNHSHAATLHSIC